MPFSFVTFNHFSLLIFNNFILKSIIKPREDHGRTEREGDRFSPLPKFDPPPPPPPTNFSVHSLTCKLSVDAHKGGGADGLLDLGQPGLEVVPCDLHPPSYQGGRKQEGAP